MPNHCTNSVVVTSNRVADIVDSIKSIETLFDFDLIIPQPEQIKNGGEGWYDWRCENWGTKWNSYDLDACGEDDTVSYSFFTAWSPPEPVIAALAARFPDAKIVHFFEEAGMCFIGEVVYEGGREVSRFEPEWDSEEGIQFRKDRGCYFDEDEDEEGEQDEE